jgi:hypothetical protein
MNPVTLKELRQLTRSRTIAGAIIGFFLLQFVIASLAIVAQTDSKGVLSSDCGDTVFVLLATLLAPILAFVVPGNIFARLVSEHGPGRAELLCATALRPSALVDGKIRSGLAMLALFLAGALPFLLCSYLLGGVDVLFVLSWALAVACCASVAIHLSIFLAALRLPAPTRWAAWALCAIPGVFFALFSAPGYEELDWNDWRFLVTGGAIVVTANLVLRGLAIALIAPPATDRVRPLRLTVLGLWLAWLAFVVASEQFSSSSWGPPGWYSLRCIVANFAALSGFGILPLAAFDLSSPSGPSRRVLLDRPRSRLRRLLRFPFSTGAESGLAFALLLLGGSALLSYAAWPWNSLATHGLWDPGSAAGFEVLWCYLLAALLLARALTRLPPLARRNAFRFTALVAAAFVGMAMLVPNLVALGRSLDPELSPFNLAGIDFDGYVKAGLATPARWGANIRFHALWAAASLALGLALNAVPFARSLKKYLSR